MRRVWLAAVALSILASPARAQSADARPLPERFPVGETLIYDARFGFINIGQAAMQVLSQDTIRGIPTLHIAFFIQGGTFFYKMNDRMDSWIGLADFASRRFIQDFDEAGRKRYNAYEIYPDSGFYRQAGVDSAITTSPDPLDDAAFFYFARTVPLDVGKRYEFNRYFRPDRNPVVLDVLARDTIDVPAGRFPTVVIQPTIKGRGILAEASEPRMWLSDDDRRIMVQLKSRFPFGVITFRLRSAEHRGPEGREERR
ncbi:MAG: DUF3108 domain-containing protein [Gemmatimonadetes bacterium]|nr:DUF3108 domain-containing protein [Gemmatimonadota bacterium]